MYSKVQFFRTMALLGSLAVTPALADDWPKRGLAANDDVPIYEFGGSWEGDDSQVNWQYNWDSTTTQKQTFAEYVPMLWGTASDHTTDWFDNAWYWLDEGGSGHLLAFNEPEIATQSDIDPTDAAAAYLTYMQPFAGYAQLGSPAVSNDGYDWMSEFLTACSTCEIDFLAVHWYNDYTEFADLQNWITEMCTLGDGRLIWLTEFEAYGTIDEQSTFLSEAIPWLDDNTCVYRYAYFGVADTDESLLEDGGPALSPLGVQYTFTPYGASSM